MVQYNLPYSRKETEIKYRLLRQLLILTIISVLWRNEKGCRFLTTSYLFRQRAPTQATTYLWIDVRSVLIIFFFRFPFHLLVCSPFLSLT